MAKAAKKKSTPLTKPMNSGRKPSAGKPRPAHGFDVDFDPAEQLSRIRQAASVPKALQARASPDVLNRLWTIIDSRRRADAEVKGLLARKMRGGVQFGVIPFAVGPDGAVSVLLLTSRETKRWVVPKGWPMRHRKPHEAAAQEAFEEAGVTGTVFGKRPVGQYSYSKVIAPSVALPCVVKLFLFQVSDQAEEWPERHERTVRWFDPHEASEKVAEPELAALLRKLPALIHARRKQASKRSRAARLDVAEKDITA